ncbi:MAG: hypothetical protein CV082_00130 [Candidatus Brocadia sp. BL1]|nr:MAG: hypothetical protein CV082_00130 [Candidatus Brocadia sp. BL1]
MGFLNQANSEIADTLNARIIVFQSYAFFEPTNEKSNLKRFLSNLLNQINIFLPGNRRGNGIKRRQKLFVRNTIWSIEWTHLN